MALDSWSWGGASGWGVCRIERPAAPPADPGIPLSHHLRTETVVEKLLTNWMSICLYTFVRVRGQSWTGLLSREGQAL